MTKTTLNADPNVYGSPRPSQRVMQKDRLEALERVLEHICKLGFMLVG